MLFFYFSFQNLK